MRKAITPLISIIIMLAIAIAAGAAFMGFFGKTIDVQKKKVEQKNVLAGIYSPIKIILSSDKVNKLNLVEFKVDLTPYKDIIDKFGPRFRICGDEICATAVYYYCWENPNTGECTTNFNPNWDKYIIWVRADLRSNPQLLYIVYGRGASLTTGDNVFLLYDSFDENSIDTNKWSTINNGNCSYTLSNGILTITSANNTECGLISKRTFDPRLYPYLVLEADLKASASTSGVGFYTFAKFGSYLVNGFTSSSSGSIHFIEYNGQINQGTKVLDTNFNVLTLKPVFYGENVYYTSIYEGESLDTGSAVNLQNAFAISLTDKDNETTPTVSLEVNWIRVYQTIPDLKVEVEENR